MSSQKQFHLIFTTPTKMFKNGPKIINALRFVMGGAAGLLFTYGYLKTFYFPSNEQNVRKCTYTYVKPCPRPMQPFDTEVKSWGAHSNKAACDSCYLSYANTPKPQPCVASRAKNYSLFLWIRLRPDADVETVACTAARLREYVDEVVGGVKPKPRNEILAGVGFGPEFYQLVAGRPPKVFSNPADIRENRFCPDSVNGGDILIHAKCNSKGCLENLSQLVLRKLPENSVLYYDETIGLNNIPQNVVNRQSGHEPLTVDNYINYAKNNDNCGCETEYKCAKTMTESEETLALIAEEEKLEERIQAAVDPDTGGSYVLTQKWLYDVQVIDSLGKNTVNQWMGRAIEDCLVPNHSRATFANLTMDKWLGKTYEECLEWRNQHPELDIRCTPGEPIEQTVDAKDSPCFRPFRMLRQSMHFENRLGDSGLFFAGFAANPRDHELLLERMAAKSGPCVAVKRISHKAKSACWYFPSQQELEDFE